MSWNSTEPAATSKIKDAPAVFLGNWEDLEDWMGREHRSFSVASCGLHRPGECSVVMIDGTDEIDALNDIPSAFAYDVELGLFKYNDGTQWVPIGGPIQSGTKMLFYADIAPVGWTIDTTLNDKLAYVVAGTENDGLAGGTATESGTWECSGLTADSHSLTESELPTHYHTHLTRTASINYRGFAGAGEYYAMTSYVTQYTGWTGGISDGGAAAGHTHNVSAGNTWRPPAYCFIICTKD